MVTFPFIANPLETLLFQICTPGKSLLAFTLFLKLCFGIEFAPPSNLLNDMLLKFPKESAGVCAADRHNCILEASVIPI